MGLTRKRRAFVEEYLCCWNGAEAARRAGYSPRTANRQASYLLSNVDIQALIKERLTEKAMKADEVLLRLAEQARADIGAMLDDDGTLSLAQAKRLGLTHLIKSISDTSRGLRVELYNAQSALVHLGKHLRLFDDNANVNGHITIEVVYDDDSDPSS